MGQVIDQDTGEITEALSEVDKINLLDGWLIAVTQAAAAKLVIEKEQMLRAQVMKAFFPTPEEGVNNLPLENGYILKATYKLDRKVDIASLPAVFEQLRAIGVNPDPLIELKPTLATTAYKSLAIINAQAARVFEQALIIKPASPTIELKAPKVKA